LLVSALAHSVSRVPQHVRRSKTSVIGSKKLVRFEKETEHQGAVWRNGHVLASSRPPNIVSGRDFTIFVYETSLQDKSLLKFNVFVQGQHGARLPLEQARKHAGRFIL
jgi:hypothetical protein